MFADRAFIWVIVSGLLLALAALLPGRGYAAGDAAHVEALIQHAGELRNAGKSEQALSAARQALAAATERDGRDGVSVARALFILAQIYVDIGNRAEAEPLLDRAQKIFKKDGKAPQELAAVEAEQAKLRAPTRAKHARRGFAREAAREEPRPADAASAWDVVPVFYGTDRAEQPMQGRVGYSADRGRRLALGRALVTVPKLHQVPQIERPWALHIPYFDVAIYQGAEDPAQHFTLKEVKQLSRAEFVALMRERLLASSRFADQALVFIHGYNTSFDNALYRTAQIAYDLQFDGAPILYSWPSGGNLGSYTYDRESAEGSEPHLRAFLETVIKETGAKSVSIIAHSMGNQALLNVLRDLNSPPPGILINQIILAAPDVDAGNFGNLAQRIAGLSRGTTLYAAANDRALMASRNFWQGPRAGDVPAAGPVVVSGVDTIDFTTASTDIFALNHSGYADKVEILTDIGRLLEKGLRPPDRRFDKLKAINSSNGAYWRYSGDGQR